MHSPVTEMYWSVTEMHSPVTDMYSPVTEIYRTVTEIYRCVTEIYRSVVEMYRPVTEMYRSVHQPLSLNVLIMWLPGNNTSLERAIPCFLFLLYMASQSRIHVQLLIHDVFIAYRQLILNVRYIYSATRVRLKHYTRFMYIPNNYVSDIVT